MAKGLTVVKNYASVLGLRETERAIKDVKDIFERTLSEKLNLERITAPLFVEKSSGINDDLNGTERKVEFSLKVSGTDCEIVQSLAKWKRLALYRYGFSAGEGLYTDMNAIRRDDEMDNIHSVFVDQWDWERVITEGERNVEFLKETAKKVAEAVFETHRRIKRLYPVLTRRLDEEVYFITSGELEERYPDLTPKERERAILREHHTTFLMQIGEKLKNGLPHDGRSPDYDDWTLNGDLLFWNELLESPLELSSMGMVSKGQLPLTIGGGIGQSRMCLLLLEKLHIGEVQASVWGEDVAEECKKFGIRIL